jgi:hypothetical protein
VERKMVLRIKHKELEALNKHVKEFAEKGIADVEVWVSKGKIWLRIETCGEEFLQEGEIYEYELEEE